jgi:hypothetical protein
VGFNFRSAILTGLHYDPTNSLAQVAAHAPSAACFFPRAHAHLNGLRPLVKSKEPIAPSDQSCCYCCCLKVVFPLDGLLNQTMHHCS